MRRITISLTVVLFSLLILSSRVAAGSATVTGSIVNLRAGPGTQYQVVGQTSRGDQLDIVATEGQWHQVFLKDGQRAWIAGWLVDVTAAERFVKVNATVVNLRSGAGTSFSIVGQASAGDTFSVVAETGDWLKISRPSGDHAYIASWLTVPAASTIPEPVAPPEPPPPTSIAITGRVVNLRSGPGTTFSVVAQAQQGDTFTRLEEEGDWIKIHLSSNQHAYVAGWLTSPATDEDQAPPAPPAPPTRIAITGRVVNLRSGPGTGFSIVTQTHQGETFSVVGAKGEWLEIVLPSGENVFVAGWLTQETTEICTSLFEVPPVTLYGTTHTNTIVRSAPSTTYSQIAQLGPQQRVEVLHSAVGWHQVLLNSGATGWVEGSLLRLSHSKTLSYTLLCHQHLVEIHHNTTVTVTGSRVNVRSGPSTNHAIVTTVSANALLQVVGTNHDWLEIRTPEGTAGWIAKWLTSPSNTADLSRVSLSRTNTQKKTLTIEGSFSMIPSIHWAEDGKALLVTIASNTVATRLPINMEEFQDLSVNENGVMLRFYARPQAEIIERSTERVVITFRAAVPRIELLELTQRDIVRIHTRGNVTPTVTHDNRGNLRITMPETTYTGQVPPDMSGAAMARSINVEQAGSTLRMTVDSAAQGRYIVRQYANHVDVELLQPGLVGKVIMLDPGHGGSDPGAIGPTGLYEKTPNLDLALRLKALLDAEGAVVLLTRDGDHRVRMPQDYEPQRDNPFAPLTEDLRARAAMAEMAQVDLFISIHNNGNHDRSIAGTTTYYHPSNLNSDASRHLAGSMQQALLGLGRRDRGVRTMNAAVLRATTQPAVLLEVVYVTNAQEEMLLSDPAFLQKAAEKMRDGLKHYFSP